MKSKPVNLPASVSTRLRNLAKEQQTDFALLLRRFALERLLFRLSRSKHRERFVLKGAMLFSVWLPDPFRPTQDLDLLGYGDATAQSVAAVFRDVCRQKVPDDGLVFDTENMIVEAIREDQEYGGIRVRTKAFMGKTRIPIQVDIGFGDAVTPAPDEIEFPVLLDGEKPNLRAYPRESVAAEKFQAIVALGMPNSRMKDFYDLLVLARLFSFDGRAVSSAIRATFERRATPIPARRPTGLSKRFTSDPRLPHNRSAGAVHRIHLPTGAQRHVCLRERAQYLFLHERLSVHARRCHLSLDVSWLFRFPHWHVEGGNACDVVLRERSWKVCSTADGGQETEFRS